MTIADDAFNRAWQFGIATAVPARRLPTTHSSKMAPRRSEGAMSRLRALVTGGTETTNVGYRAILRSKTGPA